MAELFSAGVGIADLHLATKWREEEVKYRKLEILRRQIDEKVEQLRSIAHLAALIAGFDVVVLIEIEVAPGVPTIMVALFGATSAITVCLMCLCFMICTLMLVGVLKAFDLERAKMPFRQFWVVKVSILLLESFNRFLITLFSDKFDTAKKCEEDWMRAFWFFTAGVPLFMINLALAGWVKYFNFIATAVSITVVCVIGIGMWIQVHLKWGKYLSEELTYADQNQISVAVGAVSRGSNQNNVNGSSLGTGISMQNIVPDRSEGGDQGADEHAGTSRAPTVTM